MQVFGIWSRRLLQCFAFAILLTGCGSTAATTAATSAAKPVARKGVTLAGGLNYFIQNNYANLREVLNTGAGVIGVNLPWSAATQDCSSCAPRRPADPRYWDDPTYAKSQAVQQLDEVSSYVAKHGNGAFLMVIVYNTPAWANCPADLTADPQHSSNYPPQNAADFGNFMYAMSERYSGNHKSDSGIPIGFVRDWVIYNEVNTPAWWHNTACNSGNYGPVHYYGDILNQAYTAVHHLPASSGVRVLAGAFTSYYHRDYQGDPGLRISTDYQDWATQTSDLQHGVDNAAWISPLDFVTAMQKENLQFDAIALHPYPPKIYGNPLQQPPSGAVSLGNISTMLKLLRTLWPNNQSKWHLCLTEYFQQSYYGNESLGWDHAPGIACPNYFCASTTESNLDSFLLSAYGPGGSDQPYVDYLIWAMWQDIRPYTGGLVRADGSDKNESLGSGSVRATFTAIGR